MNRLTFGGNDTQLSSKVNQVRFVSLVKFEVHFDGSLEPSVSDFGTLDDSAHEFQSQGESIVTCTLLLLALNDPKSHLWLTGPGIKPGSLTPKANTIPLHQLDPAENSYFDKTRLVYLV